MTIVLIVLIAVLIVTLCCAISMDEPGGFVCGMFGGIMLVFISVLIALAIRRERIEIVPVYQNKTTLQITYLDSVAMDTVVVFKEDIAVIGNKMKN